VSDFAMLVKSAICEVISLADWSTLIDSLLI
jgi:hypothetical protein